MVGNDGHHNTIILAGVKIWGEAMGEKARQAVGTRFRMIFDAVLRCFIFNLQAIGVTVGS